MAKLWQKGYELDPLIEEFTVGEDWKLDGELLISDLLSSIAHARGLNHIELLEDEELEELEEALRGLLSEALDGSFAPSRSDEDGHTAIENALVERLGETGKKIHTGRSRNDQILTALRVYGRDASFRIIEEGVSLLRSLLRRARENETVPMVGRTHMQKAMPSSLGMWAAAFTEELRDDLYHFFQTAVHIDQSPLGSAASYGTPIPLDRDYVRELLGFRALQRNVLYANNSRGKFESLLLDAAEQVMLTLSKMAQDLIIFSLPEFDYISLPDELCSGSSIMPQKKNPDALELIRGKTATMGGYAQQIKAVIRSLPSGYNRDFQEAKEPFLRGLRLVHRSLRVMERTVDRFEVNEDAMEKSFTPEVFATDAVFDRVKKGESFRDAYREIAGKLDELGEWSGEESIKNRKSEGSAGNLGLDELSCSINEFFEDVQKFESKSRTTLKRLADARPTALWDSEFG